MINTSKIKLKPREPLKPSLKTRECIDIEDCNCSLGEIIFLVRKELSEKYNAPSSFFNELLFDITIDVNEKEIFFSAPNSKYEDQLEIYNEKYKIYLSELEKYNEWGKKQKVKK